MQLQIASSQIASRWKEAAARQTPDPLAEMICNMTSFEVSLSAAASPGERSSPPAFAHSVTLWCPLRREDLRWSRAVF